MSFRGAWIGELHTTPREPHPSPDLLVAQAWHNSMRLLADEVMPRPPDATAGGDHGGIGRRDTVSPLNTCIDHRATNPG
jgi:hypothetical protein